MKSLIFTLVGKDKPGLIDSLAQRVYALDGNWLASNVAHMAGQFAGFVQVDLPEENHQKLISEFEQHPDLVITMVSADEQTPQEMEMADIAVMGNDKRGIVQELTAALNQFNINILRFESSCESAPNWGGLLFKAHARIQIPVGFDLDPLQASLENIANDLVVDIDLKK